ncbi:Isocitrate dehydrogenase [NAD] subunit gamma 1, mitochondrial [Toxocara canis]|uniref:Isocitrate dehydrogenase [NAD] subunit gamma 1, mitochondrial n=1 Tax=Toxocara canis TaxID=6265 RepID=A0A0B2VSC5_TOXCA|nr:Isocitrate dehydrogenase [NAD] subunit gamma 1, mitochondrial [Toxocara canis]
MLKENKTPKDHPLTPTFTTACDECKMLVTRFAEAMKDPAKVAELKAILGFLCHETSYVEECKVFVSKLDYFIQRLEPYLKDAENVCKHFHMCENSKILQFHRIGVLYAGRYMSKVEGANDLVCEECQFAAGELKNLVDEEQSQKKLKKFLSEEVCSRLGKYRGSCDLMLDEFIPELFEELSKLLNNTKQFCADLGLCKMDILMLGDDTAVDEQRPVQKAVRLEIARGEGGRCSSCTMDAANDASIIFCGCTECRMLLEAVLMELENITRAATGVLKRTCSKLAPITDVGKCTRFAETYGWDVLPTAVKQFTSVALCEQIKCCTPSFRDASPFKLISRNWLPKEPKIRIKSCRLCRIAVSFINDTLTNADFEEELENGIIYYVCQNLPESFYNLCENLCLHYTSHLISSIVNYLNSIDICEKDSETGVPMQAMHQANFARYGGRQRVTMLPGDGIGPEMLAHVKNIFAFANVPVDFEEVELSSNLANNGKDLESAIIAIQRNGVALKGSIATKFDEPQFRSLNVELRKRLDLFANILHCVTVPTVPSRHTGIDLIVIRENTEGEYSGLEHETQTGIVESLKIVTRKSIERIARFAFDYALSYGRRKVTAVHKANIQKLADGLFLHVCEEIAARDYPQINFEAMIVDNASMQLVSHPQQFDVMLMPNLYGNVISSIACGLVGGAGLVSGVNIGDKYAVFETGMRNTGRALAGKDVANPTSFIRAGLDMLRFLGLNQHADLISDALFIALTERNMHTADIQGSAKSSDLVNTVIEILEERREKLREVENPDYTDAAKRIRRIIHANDAHPGQYPFFVNVVARFPHTPQLSLCGGVLLTAETVLTAAHCVYDPDWKQMAAIANVTINDYFLMQKEQNDLLMISSDFDVNDEYKATHSSAYDIALVYLPRRVEICDMTSKFMVVPLMLDLSASQLTMSEIVQWSNCFMLGSGITDVGQPSPTLQRMVVLSMIVGEDIRRRPLLMSPASHEQRACFGDSGGPVLCALGTKFFQVGVSSEIAEDNPKLSKNASVLRVCRESDLLLISPLHTNLPIMREMMERRGLASRMLEDQLKCAREHYKKFGMW